MADLYAQRPLALGHPELEKQTLEGFLSLLRARPDDTPRLERLLLYLDRLVGSSRIRKVLVLGCGPRPEQIRILRDKGYQVIGIEPALSYVKEANEYLGAELVYIGAAEHIDQPDNSQDLVLFESVLEHVDSPLTAMREIYRVTAPGSACVVITTNRHRLSLTGKNGEFSVPFYNWFPRLVKESYVFEHLHYRPGLANYATRPAVHWFTYAELCQLGRTAGFAQFYSLIDLVRAEDAAVRRSVLRRTMLKLVQRSPWVRALALTQLGDTVLMLKRQ